MSLYSHPQFDIGEYVVVDDSRGVSVTLKGYKSGGNLLCEIGAYYSVNDCFFIGASSVVKYFVNAFIPFTYTQPLITQDYDVVEEYVKNIDVTLESSGTLVYEINPNGQALILSSFSHYYESGRAYLDKPLQYYKVTEGDSGWYYVTVITATYVTLWGNDLYVSLPYFRVDFPCDSCLDSISEKINKIKRGLG